MTTGTAAEDMDMMDWILSHLSRVHDDLFSYKGTSGTA